MRVAIVAGPDPARAFPAAALSHGLVGNGDDVLFMTGKRWLPRLHEQSIPAEELPGVSAEPGSFADLHYRTPEGAAAMTPALAARLQDWQPDLVIVDVKTPAGGLAAELLSVPWGQLHPHPLWLSGESAQLGRSTHRIRRTRGFQRSRPAQHSERPGTLTEARASLGLPAQGPSPVLHLVATLPGLEPPRLSWPSNASVVGPLIWDPADTDLTPPEGSDPLVLACPSTAPTGRAGLLDAALDGLHGLRLAGVVLEPWDKPLPPWAAVGPGRIEPLLGRASVVVTGGGHGALVRALTAGVPLVLVPGDRDQTTLARQAEALGVAAVVRRLNPRTLRRAVDRVLGDREYAVNARQIARTVATADPVVLCHQVLVGLPTSDRAT